MLPAGDVIDFAADLWLCPDEPSRQLSLLPEGSTTALGPSEIAVLAAGEIHRILDWGASQGIFRRAPGYTVLLHS